MNLGRLYAEAKEALASKCVGLRRCVVGMRDARENIMKAGPHSQLALIDR